MKTGEIQYGGFWKRALAHIIDASILGFIILIITIVIAFISSQLLILNILFIPFTILYYYIFMESSEKQATLGKMALNLKVVDNSGNRISISRSALRTIVKLISFQLTLNLVALLIPITCDKQAVHDTLANTYVVMEGPF